MGIEERLMDESRPVGVHYIADVYAPLIDLKVVPKQFLAGFIEAARDWFTVLGQGTHQFNPHGWSVLVELAESHIAIHTYPERNMLTFDVYSCGDERKAREAFWQLLAMFRARSVTWQRIERGRMMRVDAPQLSYSLTAVGEV